MAVSVGGLLGRTTLLALCAGLASGCGAEAVADARGASAELAPPLRPPSWESLGAVEAPGARYTGLAVAGGAPLLIHDTYGDGLNASYVERYEGAWARASGPLRALSAAGGQTGTPALSRDGALAAWSEYDPARFQLDVRVARLEAGAWQALGAPLDGAPGAHSDAYFPALATDAQGRPLVAWSEAENPTPYAFRIHVARLESGAWQALGEPLAAAPRRGSGHLRPALGVDGKGRVLVAWSEQDGPTFHPHLARWTGSAWEPLGDAALAGEAVLNARISLAVDAGGAPVLAWPSRGALAVKRWDGERWLSAGEGALAGAGARVLAAEVRADAQGRLVTAWMEANADGATQVRAASLEGTSWQPLGAALPVPDTTATDFHAELGPAGLPVVSWLVDTARPQRAVAARLVR